MGQNQQTIWQRKPALADELRECAKQGLSAGRTAEHLSEMAHEILTRNQVIGRGLRMKPSIRFNSDGMAGRRQHKSDGGKGKTRAPKFRPRPHVFFEPQVEPPKPADFLGLTIWQLQPDSCRFPHGEGQAVRFCGQPVIEGTSWCPFHASRVYAGFGNYRNNSVEKTGT